MHLGGIGTGNVEIGADGQLTTWQLFNTLRDGQVPFYFVDADDLVLIRTDADNTKTTLSIGGNYTVAGAGDANGGSVTLSIAPLSGSTLIIFRDPPLTQEADYTANGRFPAESHERALDKGERIKNDPPPEFATMPLDPNIALTDPGEEVSQAATVIKQAPQAPPPPPPV